MEGMLARPEIVAEIQEAMVERWAGPGGEESVMGASAVFAEWREMQDMMMCVADLVINGEADGGGEGGGSGAARGARKRRAGMDGLQSSIRWLEAMLRKCEKKPWWD